MHQNRNILIVEENLRERAALADMLADWGYSVTTSHDGIDALSKMKNEFFAVVVSNFEIPGLAGLDLLKAVQSGDTVPQMLFLSRTVSVENAVECMKAGALDFIIKPVEPEQIKHVLQAAVGSNGQPSTTSSPMVTQDPRMLRLLDMARQVAGSQASVLIQGESGTGKELLARFIHAHSNRFQASFCAVNCGALPESLLESELFGHEKGAFTGALASKPGKFELADGGTILLDEITEMKLHLQSKLLRVLQERELDRVGGLRPIKVDVRVIATTNRKLKKTIAEGDFREDLYYRLNVIPLTIPPLRERRGDIPLLAQHFIEKYNKIDGRNVKSLTSDAMERLRKFPFPGNVRELENIIERAVLLAAGDKIQETDLFLDEDPLAMDEEDATSSELPQELLTGPLKDVEKKVIFHTLGKTNGNRTHAAKRLGISVRTLRNKLNEYRAAK